MARDLVSDDDIHKITESESVKNILVKTLLNVCTTIFQKVMAASFQDGGCFQHENHFLDSFLQTCAISMILVSNHIFLTMQNLNFDGEFMVQASQTKAVSFTPSMTSISSHI